MMELIVNVTENWGIGNGNQLLVSIHADLRRFRLLTTGKTVVLGRKTLATFPGGRPLKNRRNIILSRDESLCVEGAEVAHSVEELFSLLDEKEQVVVIGGESVYRLLLPYCERARVTKTYVNLPADRFFPDLDEMPNWEVESAEEPLEEDGIKFQYIDYVNLSAISV